jgi:uncharacterized membrane protein (DUF485 family)
MFSCAKNRRAALQRVHIDRAGLSSRLDQDRSLACARMSLDESRDPTPEVGAQTDIARLGRTQPPPAHERTADEERAAADWEAVAATAAFKRLLRAKARVIVPLFIFFVVYYFALPVLVGFYPDLMKKKILGEANAAYLFALSQFFVAWAIAWIYTRIAARWDVMAAGVVRSAARK